MTLPDTTTSFAYVRDFALKKRRYGISITTNNI
jgi:hypothetical protein